MFKNSDPSWLVIGFWKIKKKMHKCRKKVNFVTFYLESLLRKSASLYLSQIVSFQGINIALAGVKFALVVKTTNIFLFTKLKNHFFLNALWLLSKTSFERFFFSVGCYVSSQTTRLPLNYFLNKLSWIISAIKMGL